MATWHDVETAKTATDLWPDVDVLDVETLATLLDVAREQVITYAPALDPASTEPADPEIPDGDQVQTVPARYLLAQIRQAKNLYDAARVDTTGGIGDGADFVVRPYPLDWHVKAILRPTRGRPRVR